MYRVRFGDFGMAVPQAGDGRATAAIEIFFAIGVVEINAFSADSYRVIVPWVPVKHTPHGLSFKRSLLPFSRKRPQIPSPCSHR